MKYRQVYFIEYYDRWRTYEMAHSSYNQNIYNQNDLGADELKW